MINVFEPAISKLTPIHASVIYQISLIHWKFYSTSENSIGMHHLWPSRSSRMAKRYVDWKDWLLYWLLKGQQVFHQRWVWGTHCTQATKYTSKSFRVVLKLRADFTRSLEQRCQWPLKKDLCPSKFFWKNSCRTCECVIQSDSKWNYDDCEHHSVVRPVERA